MQKLDYSRKKFNNPFFSKKNKQLRKIFLAMIFIFFLFLIFSYWLLFSDFWTIKNIEIDGASNISETDLKKILQEQINSSRFVLLQQKNIFLFDVGIAEEAISKRHVLRDVKIKKIFPSSLLIEIKEIAPSLVWITDKKGYYLDEKGIAISLVSDSQVKEERVGDIEILRHKIVEKFLPVIYDETNKQIIAGDKATTQNLVEFILEINKNLNSMPYFDIEYYNYNNLERKLSAITSQGYLIHFNIDDSAEIQLNNLNLLFKNELKDRKNLDYINLQYGDKIFYK